MKNNFEWEIIHDCAGEYTERMEVPTGWLVRAVHFGEDLDFSASICFVPDPNHEWIKPQPETAEDRLKETFDRNK